ncbi:hypothetical protein R3P38DRAFT_1373511 [Favolaschia claudopus]|uniref:Uncharacterized protein n=1 Tax=Favolaschia claudopus TaxID=2862362 RepID=A0AAW0DU82_9AGAR
MFRGSWGSIWNWFTGSPAEGPGENLPKPVMLIRGGTGGPGGSAMYLGGQGGQGEGPRIYNPVVETAVHGNLYYQHPRHYSIIAFGPIPPRTMENWVLPIAYRFAEFTVGDKEKVLFVMYCALMALWLPGPLDLVHRLGLVPLLTIPFLVIPRLLLSCQTITLVDVTGERRPILLDLWRNARAFVEELREIFDGNAEIMRIVLSHHYRIQNRESSVYRLGSRQVTAGAVIFMAAIIYGDSTTGTRCPYCKTKVPVSAAHNFDTTFDCDRCHQRFSISLSRPPGSPGGPPTAQISETGEETIQTPSPPDTALFKIVHLLLYSQVRRKAPSREFNDVVDGLTLIPEDILQNIALQFCVADPPLASTDRGRRGLQRCG